MNDAQQLQIPNRNQGLDPNWVEGQKMKPPAAQEPGALINISLGIGDMAAGIKAHAAAIDHLADSIFTSGLLVAAAILIVGGLRTVLSLRGGK